MQIPYRTSKKTTSPPGKVWLFGFACAGVLLSGFLFAGTAVCAAEPWRAFLDGLRQRQLHDTAILYLDRMDIDSRCPADLKEVIDYEAGITLMTGSRSAGNVKHREQMLDDALKRFKKFLAEHPGHALAPMATNQLANVLVERGVIRADQARQPATSPEQKNKLLADARAFYGQAHEAFDKARGQYATQLKNLGSSEETAEKRSQLHNSLQQARIFAATAVYEIGMTYPEGGKDRENKLTESAEQFAKVYRDYGSRLAGLHARLYEGRCYQKLGRHQRALAIFEELANQQNDSQEVRELTNKATSLILETLNRPEVKQYAKALERFNEWDKNARGDDASSADGLAIKYLAAEAGLELARSLPKDDPQRSKLIETSSELLRLVARAPGDYRKQAKTKLLDPLLVGSSGSAAEPKTFDEARERADVARDRMQAAYMQDQLARSQGNTDNHNRYLDQIALSRDEAIRGYRKALSLATPKTPVKQLNSIRYYLAFLLYQEDRFHEAAVLGHFLANRYPDSPVASEAAKIALAAHAGLYNTAPEGPDKEFARACMAIMANTIIARWPASSAAGDAQIMLIQTALLANDLESALGTLEKMPGDSPKRGEAEVMLGRAIWTQWARAMRRDDADRPTPEALDAMLDQACKLMSSGLDKVATEEGIDPSTVATVLALAQIRLQQNRPAEAIRLLEDTRLGGLAAARAGNPAMTENGRDIEVFKTALRAYVALQQMDQAEAVINDLEKRVTAAGDDTAASRLTQVYIALSREIESQLETLRRQNRTQEMARTSRGFEVFLNRIADRKQGNTFNSLAWVAGTFCDLGGRFDSGHPSLSRDADNYYRRAADIYQNLLKRCKKEPGFAPSPEAVDSVKIRLARCLRRLNRFDEAMKLLLEVLVRRNRMVDAQIEAAYVYQDWAAAGETQNYLLAIRGGRPAKRKDGSTVNVVWGWGKLANLLLRSEKHLDSFHEARYNLALCRYEYAMTLPDKSKEKALAMAEKDISMTRILSPKMGGDAWRGKYDALLKKIQHARGKKPVGLESPKHP